MATISISVNTAFDSIIRASMFKDCLLGVDIYTEIASGYNNADGTPAHHVYDRTLLQFHGTLADLRLLASRMLDAVEAVETEEATEQRAEDEHTWQYETSADRCPPRE